MSRRQVDPLFTRGEWAATVVLVLLCFAALAGVILLEDAASVVVCK